MKSRQPSAVSRQPQPGTRNQEPGTAPLPLAGVRVLDLSRLLPGPYCTLLLAQLGAEIIKIEEPNVGDLVRFTPPQADGMSLIFSALNRNKKSITINLKTEAGKELLRKLVKTADGLVEGYRPGVMEKLGLGYESLKAINPSLVYLAITGYGQSGPYRLKAGHDLNYNSLAGVIGITGSEDGRPTIPGVQIADVPGGALFGTIAFLAALFGCRETGQGAYIDQSMTEGSLALLGHFLSKYSFDMDLPRARSMELNGKHPCYNIYKTRDGRYMSVGALEPKFWEAFCKGMGKPDWLPDQYPPAERRTDVLARIEGHFMTKNQSEWVKQLSGFDCCCEPVLTFEEVLQHPQHKDRRLFQEDPLGNSRVTFTRPPWVFGEGNPPPYAEAPRLGQHTDEVLKSIGLTDSDLANLRSSGAI